VSASCSCGALNGFLCFEVSRLGFATASAQHAYKCIRVHWENSVAEVLDL